MVLDSGDTAWVLVSTAMVMLMTPGVGLFYGGLVRKKDVVSMIGLSFLALALVSVQWVLVGYSLSFGTDIAGFIGGLDFLGLRGVGMDTGDGTIPGLLFMAFQLVFAGITLAIITSAVAERVRIGSFIVFGLLWTTLVYDPLAHWAWGGGWAGDLGALDFAGGTVVHISSGFGALALALVIGKRIGFGDQDMEPHNIPMTMLGAALLWFGWFGFNAGSALAADGLAANAFVVTNTSAAAGALAWLFASWIRGKPSALGMVSGGIAGLVAITPAAGFVDPASALAIGAVAGVLCYKALLFRVGKGLDESLDAWAVHGVGGLWGAVATGIFAVEAIGGYSGLLQGNVDQFIAQVIGAVAAVVYAFVVTYALARVVDATMGLRVTEDEEYVGLDISQHGEKAYA
ncbi:MAG: ammonium transporter [Methanothrix sp.]|jgi:Amt family ammonium transporter|uniref:Ammonium transporter n=1 Tax=Methanothrix harundinacea TaxID=301375 RepID=A0A101IJ19_9EURY|nr:MAG: Ammonium transporter [Methanothrix harundinacea]MDD2638787.1 ammonium transporter [Methanothrix sp.]MDI9399936.1 ammonium transporter [Euryarchaeota archaeon]KUK96137.1 MAG: Ammonium transporter [Methanothrix harundinacea]MCP1392002.1 ammonium transporter [Methanothrix harundinacea]